MNNSQALIAGFNTYAQAGELALIAPESAPGWTPTVFLTASSPECVAFSVGASAGAITSASITINAGC